MNIETARAAGKKIFALIDGKSVFYRGYYAMPNLSARDGRPTGGVYGFTALALEMINRIKPDYVAVAWDKPKTNIRRRKQIFEGYKANRKPAPPDFYAQIPILEDLLRAFGWPLYQLDDYEADDIMGTLSQMANQQDIHTVLISSDLDMLQLIDDDTEVYALKKGLSNLEKFDVEAFEQKYGISVSQFLDLKSLKGDASDNIPGVPGIGEKTAISLLQQYGNLDGVYQHLDEIKGATGRKLADGRDSAYMSKELAKIWCDAPLELDLAAVDINNLDRSALRQKLLDLEFTSLLRRLPDGLVDDSVEERASAKLSEIKIQNLPGNLGKNVLAVTWDDRLYLSDKQGVAYESSFVEAADILSGHIVATYDAKLLTKQFISRNLPADFTIGFDIKHAGFLLNSLVPAKDLTDRLQAMGLSGPTATDAVAICYQLWDEYSRELSGDAKLDKLAKEVDFPLQVVLAKIESRGMLVDVEVLGEMSHKLDDEIELLQQSIWQHVGYEFNIGSPKQLSDALFTKLQLTSPAKRNKNGSYPTGVKELTRLKDEHPVINLISEYRELTKLKSTYIDALPKAIGSDGRIHTNLDQDVTSTGRLSSSNPNLQNIPTRSERGRKIKRAFVAPAGRVLINADYAQFELRLAAALAGDKNMIKMFSDPANDIHTMTAAEAYGISCNEVTPEQRRHAKVINFGVLYGMSPHGLSEATGMSQSTAKEFIDRYFAIRKPIRDFINRTLIMADEQGYVETLFGRRRPTPDVKSANFMVREAAKRAAANMPIQGTEADLMKMAMIKIEQIVGATQIMQVHDSIMVECDEADARRIADEMKQVMENIYPELGVRLLVDVKIGHNWAEI